jgi:hypothetical protein
MLRKFLHRALFHTAAAANHALSVILQLFLDLTLHYSHSKFSSNLPTLKCERPSFASFASGFEDLSQAMKLKAPPVVSCTPRRNQTDLDEP